MNESLINKKNERIFFFDNIRYLLVFLVVVFHMTCAYTNYANWWAVNDDNSVFFDYLMRLLNLFLMPVLFFISGYFALPSLHRYGSYRFLKKKIIRLGIPWLVGVLLVGPIRIYIYQYSRGFEDISMWQLFVLKTQEAATFYTGFITSSQQFHHSHFWFLSLLLFFFFVFVLLHKAISFRAGRASPENQITEPSIKSIILVFVLISIVTAVITLIMFLLFIKEPGKQPFVIIASILQFQPTRVGLYTTCFATGIYTFYKNWFYSIKTLGSPLGWLVLTLLLLLAEENVFASLTSGLTPVLGVAYVTIKSFLVFSIIMSLMTFGGKYWNSGSKLNQLLANNSYSIYLIHFVIVLSVQLVMYKWWNVTIYAKFVTGSILSLALSFLFSEFAVRRYPKSSILGVVSLFCVLVIVLN